MYMYVHKIWRFFNLDISLWLGGGGFERRYVFPTVLSLLWVWDYDSPPWLLQCKRTCHVDSERVQFI